jgi:hypothetical protein
VRCEKRVKIDPESHDDMLFITDQIEVNVPNRRAANLLSALSCRDRTISISVQVFRILDPGLNIWKQGNSSR